MFRTSLLCALAATTACSFGDDRPLGGGGDAGPDGTMDGPPVVEKDHLLLTEIKSSGDTTEFIEIWNPTNRSINLSNYYLTDVGDYWKLPSAPPVVINSDILVRFPAGAMIQSKQVITVAMEGAMFGPAYPGVQPTYALDAATGPQAMGPRIGAGALGEASLTDGGEILVLFYWDGTSDLVKDVDMAIAGTTAAGANALVAKLAVDGPDADTTATMFKPDNGLLGGGMNAAALANTSYKRRKLEMGSETQADTGNGITGDDETSEALKATWDGDAANPLSAPTPGTVPSI